MGLIGRKVGFCKSHGKFCWFIALNKKLVCQAVYSSEEENVALEGESGGSGGEGSSKKDGRCC